MQQPVTQLLAQWRDGDERAFAQLSALMYEELRQLAQRHLRRERSNHTIQKTALVNEAFVRLVGQQAVDWQSRAHFIGLASKLMRRVLVDYARARLADKRGGGAGLLSLDEMTTPEADEAPDTTPTALQHLDAHTQEEVSAIDQALVRLEQIDERQAQIVEMRYFGGLTVEQTAEAMDISEATVKREWTLARAWLRRELGKSF
ncbi:MAG TPA: sigma-70 family RNA polymerase sigma factor [Steroidobacteraceae bacterium]|jgi:RNA polymerase sigma factor (TIGR02999 family)|nr:sigma-70 family RNA polymerase sigma factor [Steroidobacteraceae bacterium]